MAKQTILIFNELCVNMLCTTTQVEYETQCVEFCLFLLSGKLKLKHVCMCRCSLEWVDWKEGSLAFSQDRSIGRQQLEAIVACCLQTAGAPARKGGPSLVLLPTLLMGELFSSEISDPKTVMKLCNSNNSLPIYRRHL